MIELSRLRAVCFVTLTTLLFAACTGTTQGYAGAARSSDEVATVKPQGVRIHRVNGVDVAATSSGATVLPGTNELELSIDQSNFNLRDPRESRFKLRLEAKAGVTYAITGRRGGEGLCAFPIDPGNGQPDYTAPAGCLYRE